MAFPRRDRYLMVALAVGYLGHVAWRLWLTRGAIAPIAHPDEDGYLLAARALAGGAGGYSTENGTFRRAGYPLLLSLAYLGTDEAFAVYRRVQVINAMINAGVFPLAWLFAHRVLGWARWPALGAGFAAAALPAVVYYVGMAMTDAVLPTMVLGWLVLTHGWIGGGSGWRRWTYPLGAGALVGGMYALHVRGLMIAAGYLVLTVILLVARRVPVVPALSSVGLAVGVAAVDPLCRARLGDAVVLLGAPPDGQLASALTVDWGVALILLRALGQGWYLAVATLGLGAVGLVAVVSSVARRESRARWAADPELAARAAIGLLVLATTVLIALGSAASLPFGDHRITYFAYPRYLHFLFPVWLLLGWAGLAEASRRARAMLVAAASTLLVGTAAVVRWRTAQSPGHQFVAFDAPELLALSGQWRDFPVLWPTGAALGGLVLLWAAALGRRRRASEVLRASKVLRASEALIVAALAVTGTTAIQYHLNAPVVAAQYPDGGPRLVRDLRLTRDDVVAEASQVAFPYLFNHAREVSWHRLVLFDGRQAPPAGATVVIAPWYAEGRVASWHGTSYGLRQVYVDRAHGWAAWRPIRNLR